MRHMIDFEMLMDGYSKNSYSFFSETPFDAAEWMKKF